jgi:predicted nucleic acid-binding protein
VTKVLVDTGFLVALFDPADLLAAPAANYLKGHKHSLATTTAVVVEACFFLSPGGKADLLAWLRRGAVAVLDVPVAAYMQLETTLRKYSDQEIDFADAALVWLAGEMGTTRVLTVDRTDFEVFRVKGSKRFEVIDWY